MSPKQRAHIRQINVPHIYRRNGIWRVRTGWGMDLQAELARAYARRFLS